MTSFAEASLLLPLRFYCGRINGTLRREKRELMRESRRELAARFRAVADGVTALRSLERPGLTASGFLIFERLLVSAPQSLFNDRPTRC